MVELEGRHVVVTGGTGALGEHVVASMLARGAVVHVPTTGSALPERLAWRGHPNVRPIPNLRFDDEPAVRRVYADLPSLWASIHLVGGFTWGSITDATLDDLRRMWVLNVETCWLCCREAVRAMPSGGRIVNVSARHVLEPKPDLTVYAAAKGAVAALTTSLAAEVRDRGILVNAVVPSVLDTPANRRDDPGADFARWPKPAQVAETIAFLASPTNAVTSGALVPVYGRV